MAIKVRLAPLTITRDSFIVSMNLEHHFSRCLVKAPHQLVCTGLQQTQEAPVVRVKCCVMDCVRILALNVVTSACNGTILQFLHWVHYYQQ